ncbi:hypothetical protein JCM4814A_26390 [Streptomyces phaeofaciens JCM 4814]|uniref:Uncharacterized protein n=1 Tax=Streptomyces phaeofaciens TaxID=68254 RepID=A0A918LQU3_9ACTN|nr:hypothetical protein GCM10010226_11720 [Streptomyces phaeofaciens]
MVPGSPTDRSRSPSATRTATAFGSTLVGGTEGSSVEDMRAMLRDDHAEPYVFGVTGVGRVGWRPERIGGLIA